MIQIVLIEKNGSLKQNAAKDVSRNTLYKKCGFKKPDGFEKRTTWNVKLNKDNVIIELWAKDDGKAGMENKYELPQPVDENLYFGTCVLIRTDEDGNIINLTTDVWNKVYEILFGGFDNIEEDDEEESEDELETVLKSNKTKSGYLKNDFVVNDDSCEEEYDEEDDDENDDEDDDDGERDYNMNNKTNNNDNENDIQIDNTEGLELEEEEYEYSS